MVCKLDEDDLIYCKVLAAEVAGGGGAWAFESTVLCTEYKYIHGNSFETSRAVVPLQDVAGVAIRCAALGRPGV